MSDKKTIGDLVSDLAAKAVDAETTDIDDILQSYVRAGVDPRTLVLEYYPNGLGEDTRRHYRIRVKAP